MSFLLRDASAADAGAIAEVHIETWRTAFRPLVSANVLDSLSVEAQLPRWNEMLAEEHTRAFVAEQDEKLIGFCTGRPCADADRPGSGEVHTLYVLPRAWRKGIGRALIERLESRLLADGFRSLSLWVLTENLQARRFYESQGYQPDGTHKTVTLIDVDLPHTRYVRSI